MLSIVFSLNVSAAEVPQHEIRTAHRLYNTAGSNFATRDSIDYITPLSNEVVYWELESITGYNKVVTTFTVRSKDGTPLVNKGSEATVSLNDIFYSICYCNDSSCFYDRNIEKVRVLLFFTDGSTQYVDNVTYNIQDSISFNTSFTFTPNKDVLKYEIIVTNEVGGLSNTILTLYAGSDMGHKFALSVSQDSKEAGLLAGIIEWVKNIANSITELPAKIWEFISDGLKSLFVPSEEFIIDFKDDMDLMLSEKLGAVYQVINVTFESWDRITDSDTTNFIDMPQVTIDLPNNNSFTFGGFSVQVVPNGFDFLVNAIKLITGILCTVVFINGLRKRYDEFVGVEQ